MYCDTCGSLIKEGQSFCANCGAPVQAIPQAVPQAAPQPVQQPAPQPAPVAYQQPAPAPQPAPVAYQQPQPVAPVVQQTVQAAPQTPVPALANTKAGPRSACFVIGLITCILLIVLNVPALAIGATMIIVGPFALMLGASNSEDIFLTGLLVCIGSFLLVDMAIISIVFNGISSKITAKRPASKCRKFRMAAAVMVLIDSLITVAPVIGLNVMMSDAEFFYGIFAVVLIMAIVYFVLAIITNSKEKKLASAVS
ncbi:MAG: zinc ribbon domain-containing protein [Saccharofermentans sp.]|nr:zinc ribbon domain-containing protein [Saccharofermentans sp.]